MLALHPHYQDQLYDELSMIKLDDATDVTFEEVAQLSFLDMFIKETMRLYPSVPYLTRKATKDMRLGEHIIPSGTELLLNVIHAQRNPKNFKENPTKFDPYNFLPDKVAERHPYSFLPFSSGIRGCIGIHFILFILCCLIFIFLHFIII